MKVLIHFRGESNPARFVFVEGEKVPTDLEGADSQLVQVFLQSPQTLAETNIQDYRSRVKDVQIVQESSINLEDSEEKSSEQ